MRDTVAGRGDRRKGRHQRTVVVHEPRAPRQDDRQYIEERRKKEAME
jgi:hypothetical protein